MNEIWKDVVGYEGIYQVSNLGRIKALPRKVKVCGGAYRLIGEHIVKPTKCKNGYLEAAFSVRQKREVRLLHRVVAQAFIENPDNLPEVNHIDEDITNCHADNLEWCTSKYNANYGTRNERVAQTKKQTGSVKAVYQFDLNGNLINRFEKISDAAQEVGADISAIIRVCKGKQQTSMGYRWEYAS